MPGVIWFLENPLLVKLRGQFVTSPFLATALFKPWVIVQSSGVRMRTILGFLFVLVKNHTIVALVHLTMSHPAFLRDA
jgi:hypothetical protein